MGMAFLVVGCVIVRSCGGVHLDRALHDEWWAKAHPTIWIPIFMGMTVGGAGR